MWVELSYVIVALISFYIGYTIAKGIDNNHRELFLGYIDETRHLNNELNYWKESYFNLCKSVADSDLVEDTIEDARGNIIGIIFKKEITTN